MTHAAIPDGEVDEIRKRCDAATIGPWVADGFAMEDDNCVRVGTNDGSEHYYHKTETICECFTNHDEEPDGPRIGVIDAERNAEFIAHARTDIPLLLARLTALEAELAALKAEVAEARAKCANVCFEIGNAYMAKSAHNLPASEKAQVAFECEKRIRSQGEQGR
jgi:hypothetical protein